MGRAVAFAQAAGDRDRWINSGQPLQRQTMGTGCNATGQAPEMLQGMTPLSWFDGLVYVY